MGETSQETPVRLALIRGSNRPPGRDTGIRETTALDGHPQSGTYSGARNACHTARDAAITKPGLSNQAELERLAETFFSVTSFPLMCCEGIRHAGL